jgi:hypothetical protein
MKPGDVAIIFTPDDTHFSIASAAINAGLHVLVAKPIVKSLEEHKQLVALAKRQNVLVGRIVCGCGCGSGVGRAPGSERVLLTRPLLSLAVL